jgi:hypothetical protein
VAQQYALDFMQSQIGKTDIANAIQLFRREFRNPYLEFLFKGVNARTFNMEFTFTPKNEKEARSARNIINLFKFHQMPEYNRDNVLGEFYLYPSEFDIYIFGTNTENKFINKFSTSALTSCTVSYNGSGQHSFFREDSELGASPTVTHLALQFSELELMTRQRISQGY